MTNPSVCSHHALDAALRGVAPWIVGRLRRYAKKDEAADRAINRVRAGRESRRKYQRINVWTFGYGGSAHWQAKCFKISDAIEDGEKVR